MCGRRLKIFSALLVLSFLSVSLQSLSPCYAEVKLSDQEAMEMMNEIQESKKDLIQVKNELKESKMESQELKMELQDVKKDYNEQKTYYEEQLNEADKKNQMLQTAVTITSASAVSLLVAVILILAL